MAYITQEDVTRAFEQQEWAIQIQPKYNIETHQIVGGEALVRWFHHEKGGLRPDLFIPELEQMGQIAELDFYVFEKVCQMLQQWQQNQIRCLPISVNVSQITLETEGFIERIKGLIAYYSVGVKLIEIEITETLICKNSIRIDQLRAEGFKIAMDDFGTGYSSLSVIKELTLDVVKIDRAFLIDVEACIKSRAIFEMIIKLLAVLEKEVVVEGVETLQQEEIIKNMGCRFAQGYLYDRPLTIEDFTNRLISVYQ